MNGDLHSTAYLLVNFGGPRNLEEVEPFLKELLCDRDVIRTRFPKWIHDWLFGRVACKRAVKVSRDYEKIGGCSPIFRDTEALKSSLELILSAPVLTFHRYLPATHSASLVQLEKVAQQEIRVVPLFPQFCYGTTGSIARFLFKSKVAHKLRWIKSYADHPAFITSWVEKISRFLLRRGLQGCETYCLFSAHGVPRAFIEEGDPYEEECNRTFSAIMAKIIDEFPSILGRLAYQSKFGNEEWLLPYTDEESDAVLSWHEGRQHIVFVPLTFTSDHIETLFEIEELYLPKIRSKGLHAHRCPALNLDVQWISSLAVIAKESDVCPTQTLVRS